MAPTIDFNQAVFTVRDIMHDNELIAYVFHDTDGDWQFLPDKEVSTDNMMIVSFGQILNHDSSTKEVLYLQEGFKAYRKNKNEDWQITEID